MNFISFWDKIEPYFNTINHAIIAVTTVYITFVCWYSVWWMWDRTKLLKIRIIFPGTSVQVIWVCTYGSVLRVFVSTKFTNGIAWFCTTNPNILHPNSTTYWWLKRSSDYIKKIHGVASIPVDHVTTFTGSCRPSDPHCQYLASWFNGLRTENIISTIIMPI